MVPGEIEAGEVFAEAVGVVGGGFAGAGDVEERAAGVGEGAGVAANFHHGGELKAVEVVDGFELGGGEQLSELVFDELVLARFGLSFRPKSTFSITLSHGKSADS